MPGGHRRVASHSWIDNLSKCTKCGAGTQVNQAILPGGDMAHEAHPFQDAYFMLGPFTSERLAQQPCHLYAVLDGSGAGAHSLAAFYRQHLPAEVLLEIRDGMEDESVLELLRKAVLAVDNVYKANVVSESRRRIEETQQRVRELRDSAASSESDLMESLSQLQTLKQSLDARCSLAMVLLYNERLYAASVGSSRALLCRHSNRRQAVRFQLLTPSSPPAEPRHLLGSSSDDDRPLVSLSGPYEDSQDWAFLVLMTKGVFHTLSSCVPQAQESGTNCEIIRLVAKELRNHDNSLLAASQSVVDNVVRLHKETVFYGDCDQQVVRDDMTLLVRDFHYRQGLSQSSDPEAYIITPGPDSADNSLETNSGSNEAKYCTEPIDAYLPLHEWQLAVDSLPEEQLAQVSAVLNFVGISGDVIREESVDESAAAQSQEEADLSERL